MTVNVVSVHLTSSNYGQYVASGPRIVPVAANIDCQNRSQVILANATGVTSQQILDPSQVNAECLSLGSPMFSFLPNSSAGYIRATLDSAGNHTTFNFQAQNFTQFLVPLTTSLRFTAFAVPQNLLFVFRNESMGAKKLQIMMTNGVNYHVDKTLARGELLVFAVQPNGEVYINGDTVSLAQTVTAANLAPGAIVEMVGADGAHVVINETTHLFPNQKVQIQ